MQQEHKLPRNRPETQAWSRNFSAPATPNCVISPHKRKLCRASHGGRLRQCTMAKRRVGQRHELASAGQAARWKVSRASVRALRDPFPPPFESGRRTWGAAPCAEHAITEPRSHASDALGLQFLALPWTPNSSPPSAASRALTAMLPPRCWRWQGGIWSLPSTSTSLMARQKAGEAPLTTKPWQGGCKCEAMTSGSAACCSGQGGGLAVPTRGPACAVQLARALPSWPARKCPEPAPFSPPRTGRARARRRKCALPSP